MLGRSDDGSSNVADVGRRVAEEVSSFADVVLQLAERMDELTVAKADKERAVQEANNDHFLKFRKVHKNLTKSFSFFVDLNR